MFSLRESLKATSQALMGLTTKRKCTVNAFEKRKNNMEFVIDFRHFGSQENSFFGGPTVLV